MRSPKPHNPMTKAERTLRPGSWDIGDRRTRAGWDGTGEAPRRGSPRGSGSLPGIASSGVETPSGPGALCRSCGKPNAIGPANKPNTKEGESGLSPVPAVGRKEFYPGQSRPLVTPRRPAASCPAAPRPAPGSIPKGRRPSPGPPGIPACLHCDSGPGHREEHGAARWGRSSRAASAPSGPAAAGCSLPWPSPSAALNFSVSSTGTALAPPAPALAPSRPPPCGRYHGPSTGAPKARPGPQPLRACPAMRTRGWGSPAERHPRPVTPAQRPVRAAAHPRSVSKQCLRRERRALREGCEGGRAGSARVSSPRSCFTREKPHHPQPFVGRHGRSGMCCGRTHWHRRMQVWVMSTVMPAGLLSDCPNGICSNL
ncbi:uncharacterized protein PRD47_013798 [Ara ararauna]